MMRVIRADATRDSRKQVAVLAQEPIPGRWLPAGAGEQERRGRKKGNKVVLLLVSDQTAEGKNGARSIKSRVADLPSLLSKSFWRSSNGFMSVRDHGAPTRRRCLKTKTELG
jgi:hypothetical protein